MAKTAVVNPPRKRARRSSSHGRARARTENPRRRRRSHRRRRRNPAGRNPYASVNYYRSPNRGRRRARRRNPDFSMAELTSIVPAATAGVIASRWAVKQSGAWEPGAGGQLEPGIKQALAIYLAATVGSDMIAQLLGSEEKGRYAKIAAFGYGGDLFLRTRFMRDSQFFQNNLSLQGMEATSMIGAANPMQSTWVDGQGQTWLMTNQGWQLAGLGQELVLVEDTGEGAGDELEGMEASSMIGAYSRRRASTTNSFGYAEP